MTWRAWLAVIAIAAAACGEDGEPIEIGDADENVQRYDLTFAANGYAIVWTTDARRVTDQRLWFAHVSRDGQTTRSPTVVADLGIRVGALQLFATPTGKYVVWFRADTEDGAPVQAITLDDNGDATGPPVMLGSSFEAGTPTVAFTGDRFTFATVTSTTEVGYGIAGVALESLGTGLMETSIEAQRDPSIAWAPAAHQSLVVWQQVAAIREARLAPDATVVGPSRLVGSTGAAEPRPRVIATETGALVAWSELEGRRIAMAVASGETWVPRVSPIPDARVDPIQLALTARGADALLVWASDGTTALSSIAALHLDPTTPTAPAGDIIEVTTGRAPRFQPRVAAGVDEFGVLFAGPEAGRIRLYFTTLE